MARILKSDPADRVTRFAENNLKNKSDFGEDARLAFARHLKDLKRSAKNDPKFPYEFKYEKANDVIADKKEQLDVLESYKKSLIYEYVTGKKEVI